jgi:hypothetical protein
MTTKTRLYIFAIAFLTLADDAAAQTVNRTYQNPMGQNTGRSTTDARGNSTYYDATGRQIGRAVQGNNGDITIYDPMGRQVGRSTTR